MKTIQRFSIAILLFSISFTACQKEEQDEQLTTEEATQQMIIANEDNSTAEALYERVDNQVDGIIDARGGGSGDCPTVTVEPSWDEFPRTITIDFGTDGCEGADGRIRMGIINVHQTAAWWVEDAVRTVTFTDFFTDGAQLEGTIILVNQGYDASENVTFSRKVEGAKVTFPDGTTFTWEADQVLTQMDGGATPFILHDNVFEFTWTSNGVNREGQAFSVNTVTPLLKDRACPWLVSGIIELTVDDKTLSLDHGDGGCDKYGTLTLPNGFEMEVELDRTW